MSLLLPGQRRGGRTGGGPFSPLLRPLRERARGGRGDYGGISFKWRTIPSVGDMANCSRPEGLLPSAMPPPSGSWRGLPPPGPPVPLSGPLYFDDPMVDDGCSDATDGL